MHLDVCISKKQVGKMDIHLICGTRNLLIEDSEIPFNFDNFILSKDNVLLSNLIGKPDFVFKVGLNSISILEKYPHFLSSGNELVYQETNLDRLSEKKAEVLQMLTCCFWFVKDNSCNTDQLHLYAPNNNVVISRIRTTVFSNSKGEYKDEIFKVDELLLAANYFDRLVELRSYDALIDKNHKSSYQENKDYNQTKPGDFNYIKYNQQNRIDRAFLFLTLARSNSFLPLKISFYIAIYESLFTTDNTEVSHKVTERATFFLEENSIAKRNVFELIKFGYSIRSKFVNGKKLDKKIKNHEDLVKLSMELDRITRKLFIKILHDDANIFLQNDDELNKWFFELLIK